MTVLALRSARYANAVSALHGHVSRRMWQSLWPGHAESEVPIGHITNGVHTPSWLATQMQIGYRYYLGADWRGGKGSGAGRLRLAWGGATEPQGATQEAKGPQPDIRLRPPHHHH